ncbi:MAG: solute:Na+ symporter, family [Acidobacteriota bacterium]|jgi:Na+/proline symporter|nr:solute:Na+ symporter, family [Acidobacteriota bacterium]
MRPLDWVVLFAALVGIVVYGVRKGRRTRDLDDFLVADRRMRWHHVALSIMATQASAITFLATPGQGFADGMRFVQVYLGLPVAMVILSVTAVPVYHRLKVYTAYEYLEGRFDLKTRTLAAFLFLMLRGLSTGVSIYAPSLILSVIMGWDIRIVIFIIGGAVMLYASMGGARAVDNTNFLQFLIIMGGMFVAFITIVRLLPADVSLLEATHVAGKLGRLNAIDFSFDIRNQYNFWSGLVGGCFLALSYFGTDQSQVQRYLTGESVAQSRLGLLFNGLVKVPMQFFILFLGAMVFAFYQFTQPPVFFNPVEAERARTGAHGAQFRALEADYAAAFEEKQAAARAYIGALRAGDEAAASNASQGLKSAQEKSNGVRAGAIEIVKEFDAKPNDTNYVFLNFVTRYMPAGLVGLVLAAVFFASMSSTASEWSALAATTVIDIQRRLVKRDAGERYYFISSKLATVFWGLFAVSFAQYAGQLGSLIEAVNRLGSLFYGTLLGIFLLGFYFRRTGGTAAFLGAIVGEAAVLYCFYFTQIAYLWFNLIGALAVVVAAHLFTLFLGVAPTKKPPDGVSA